MSNRTMDGDDAYSALVGIWEYLKETEDQKPLKKSAISYAQIGKMITDSSTIDFLLNKLNKANQKLADEIYIMEESARKEAEKQARDQAEAERNEKLKRQLIEHYSALTSIDEVNVLESEAVESLQEKLAEALHTRKQRLIRQKEVLQTCYFN